MSVKAVGYISLLNMKWATHCPGTTTFQSRRWRCQNGFLGRFLEGQWRFCEAAPVRLAHCGRSKSSGWVWIPMLSSGPARSALWLLAVRQELSDISLGQPPGLKSGRSRKWSLLQLTSLGAANANFWSVFLWTCGLPGRRWKVNKSPVLQGRWGWLFPFRRPGLPAMGLSRISPPVVNPKKGNLEDFFENRTPLENDNLKFVKQFGVFENEKRRRRREAPKAFF